MFLIQVLCMTKNQAIGVFDSGIGGLTVVNSLEKELPHEQFIYFGDTLHMPYGDKSATQILRYSEKIVEFLLSKKVKLIVIACNSASANAASSLRAQYWQQVHIMGVIRPVIQSIIRKGIQKIGIIGTETTIQSNIYPSLIKEYGADIEVYQKATPLLAPMIEAGLSGSEPLNETLREYLSDEQFTDKEAILLACTHYPLVADKVNEFFGHTKQILDNATPLANEVRKYLTEHDLLRPEHEISMEGNYRNEFYVSKYSTSFQNTVQTFYNGHIHIQQVDIH